MSSVLFTPSRSQIESSQLTRFMRFVTTHTGQDFESYDSLYHWSVTEIESFWELLWMFARPIHSEPYREVLDERRMPGAKWFSGARMNFAENLLRFNDDRTAIIAVNESGERSAFTYAELRHEVDRTAQLLSKLGVKVGDHIAAYMPNIAETVIAMLAATSLGAIWSSTSPDFGTQGAVDRFGQIKPKLLLTVDRGQYAGKAYDALERAGQIADTVQSIDHVLVVPYHGEQASLPDDRFISWEGRPETDSASLSFVQLPFDHPVYTMYSSGTTGIPKCIVHGCGGTLLQHYKEHVLHTNLTRDDVLTYYTTCGWMMWNWLVSGLQVGATILLYDGSPAYPDIRTLWRLIEREKISVFGTSPKFLTACQHADVRPRHEFSLETLRSILSTGAPLSEDLFRFVYDDVKDDLTLSSISGGTDIVSCFMLGNPNLPVRSGEIQCRGLGMKVEAWDDDGNSLIDEVGELVCSEPFPSMPVRFWNDPDQKKYLSAYFDHFPGVWTHGDFIRVSEHGGVVVYGRSDATLNPGGVRIGTAEIYTPLESLDEIKDGIVIAQSYKGDVRIVLFVVTADGVELDDDLRKKIRDTIRSVETPRHVPAVILAVPEVPYTLNGKKVEIAASRTVHGKPVPNKNSLANPNCLKFFEDRPELKID